MPLTDKACRQAKPREKAYKLSDEKGLFLLVNSNGSKWWRLKYRIAGKEKLLSLGVYSEVPLKDAREQRDDARKRIAAGIDPSEDRKSEKAALAAKAEADKLIAEGKALPGSFEFVAREWLINVHEKKVSPGHAERTRIRFEQNVFPWLGSRPLREIEAPELLTCLRRVTDRGAIETAHRIKDACGQVFRYGIASGHCGRNPAADLRDALPPTPTKHHAAIVDPKHVGELLRAIEDYRGNKLTRAALKLSALLFLRPGELRQLEWAWIDFDESMLRLPSTLMKRKLEDKLNGEPHIVPLAPQAIAVLKEMEPFTGRGRYVFRSLLTGERPMSENTVRNALRRMGYGNDDMTAHGFRAMARTMAAERLGILPEIIEAQLAHEVPDALGRAYNRTKFLDQRRELMNRWADYLDKLHTGAQVIGIKEGKTAA